MTNTNDAEPTDLTGSVDDRLHQLARLEGEGEALPASWLLRQLRAALSDWATAESELDVEVESHVDY